MAVSARRSGRRSDTVGVFGRLVCFTFLVILCLLPPARAQDAAPAEAAQPADAGPASVPADNFLRHIIVSAGWVFGPLLLLISIGLVALIVLLFLDLRLEVAIPPGFVEEFTDTVNKRRLKEAFDLTRNDPSFLARVLTVGMGRLQYGIEDAREAAGNTVESIKAGKEQLISYLATIGTLGPLLGLVGTVISMIRSFMKLGRPGLPATPQELAADLSHGLVVTMLGIGLSLPAIFFHTFFRNRLIRLSMDTGNLADDLLTQMYHNSKRPPVAAAADARPAAATVKPAE
jgi:biopolymer transport protein ExbB